MTKIFCDCCGDQIVAKESCRDNDRHRISETVRARRPDTSNAVMTLTILLERGDGSPLQPEDICKNCIFDMAASLDRRPRYEPAPLES